MKKLPAYKITTVLAACVLTSTTAHALQMRLSDGILPPFTINDNVAPDASAIPGIIMFSGSLPQWLVSVDTGVRNPSALPNLHLGSLDVSSGPGSTLTLELTEIGYAPGSFDFTSQFGGVVGLNPGSILAYATYVDAGNAPFGTTTPMSSFLPVGPGAFSSSDTKSLTLAAPFSVTMKITLAHTAEFETSSVDATFVANPSSVPDGGSSLLMLSGALALMGAARRKF